MEPLTFPDEKAGHHRGTRHERQRRRSQRRVRRMTEEIHKHPIEVIDILIRKDPKHLVGT